MNAEQIEILGTLRTRIRNLMSMYETEREEKELLKQENAELTQKMVLQDKRISELEHKYDNLKIARSLVSNGEDTHDARIKVNRIVREIDKCIALLNR